MTCVDCGLWKVVYFSSCLYCRARRQKRCDLCSVRRFRLVGRWSIVDEDPGNEEAGDGRAAAEAAQCKGAKSKRWDRLQ